MRVISYRAHNVMRIQDVQFDLDGRHLFLVGGKNGHGKSSALNGLLMALCGRSGMDWPEIALKDGEAEGTVTVELAGNEGDEWAGLTLELKLKKKRAGAVVEEFKLFGPDGKPVKEPRELLKRLYRYRGFDPQEFDRLGKSERRRVLMDLCGIDFTEDEAKARELYSERTVVNRELKNAQGALSHMRRWPDAPAASVSPKELMQELDAARAYNEETKGLAAEAESAIAESQAIQEEIEADRAKIECMKAQIAELEAAIDKLHGRAEESHRKYSDATMKRDARGVKDVDAIKRQINDAADTNAKVQENIRYDDAKAMVDELDSQSRQLSAAIDEIANQQSRRLQEAAWPVAGLSVDADGVLFDGLPYEQASKSQRLLLSTRIGMALNPALRLLVCQDGNDLDNDALDALDQLLKDEDFQLVLELVTRSKEDESRCAVVIENGKVKEGSNGSRKPVKGK